MNHKKLVDSFLSKTRQMQELKAELDSLKGKFKALAEEEDVTEFEGTLGKIVLANTTTTTVEPRALLSKLREVEREDLFPDLVKVIIPKTRNLLGDMLFEDIAEVVQKPLSKVMPVFKKGGK